MCDAGHNKVTIRWICNISKLLVYVFCVATTQKTQETWQKHEKTVRNPIPGNLWPFVQKHNWQKRCGTLCNLRNMGNM